MKYRRLGRTGLDVSVLSLGTGGPNRLGQSRYVSRRDIDRLFGAALEHGVNFFDTSGAYESSESRLGDALQHVSRDRYYLASKIFPWQGDRLLTPAEIRRAVERSLRHLRVDYLDLLQLHRVLSKNYEQTRDEVLPALDKLRAEGKIRAVGITESTTRDTTHRMLRQALNDDLYDTIMVAYHPANQLAAQTLFPQAEGQDVGVIAMSVARPFISRTVTARLRLLSATLAGLVVSPPATRSRLGARLRSALTELTRKNQARSSHPGGAIDRRLSLPEAAYAFALTPPQVATVLTGTTDTEHLERNVAAVTAPQLSAEEVRLLMAMARSRD